MSKAKTVALVVLVWTAFGAEARAARYDSQGGWIWYYYNNAYSSSYKNFYPYVGLPASTPAPTSAATPVYTAPAASTGLTFTSPSVSAPITTSTTIASPSMSAAIMIQNQNQPNVGTYNATGNPNNADAVINFSGGNFLESGQLASGTPSAWYNSPAVSKVFNGTPNPQQQADFTQTVLDRVNQTFNLAGLSPKITTDTSAGANHMISVVANASYASNPNAIGITDVGHNGFGFIDKLNYASSVDQLAWAVAHNVSHELMHAFGVANHPDSSGNYVDAGTASWDLLTNPSATFSPGAISAIAGTKYSPNGTVGAQTLEGDQVLVAPVPEPATIVGWSLALCAAVYVQRRRASRIRPA